MTFRAKTVPAALAVGAIVIAAVVHGLARRAAAPAPPSLPLAGCFLELRGDDLGRILDAARRWPVYRLVAPDAIERLGRRIAGWGAGVPSPIAALLPGRASALALYEGGWLAAVDGRMPPLDGLRLRPASPGWAVAGPSRFPEPGGDVSSLPAPPRGALGVRVAPRPGAKGLFPALLPVDAEGSVRLEPDGLHEQWRIRCRAPCALDLLDAGWKGASSARGWSAIPEDAEAIAWLRFDPSRLAHLESALSGAPAVGRAIESIEGFLDVPVRETLARSLAGPALLAVRGGDDSPGLLAVFDLVATEAARTLVERVLAIGALSETVGITRYRGVTIGTWASASGGSPLEPAVAVDGDVLLVGSARREIEDALDRRRDPPASPGSEARRRLEGSETGAWRAWSRSRFTAEGWERILDRARPAPAPAFESRASLRREGEHWVLEGGGSGPAVAADAVLPAFRYAVASIGGTRRILDPSPMEDR